MFITQNLHSPFQCTYRFTANVFQGHLQTPHTFRHKFAKCQSKHKLDNPNCQSIFFLWLMVVLSQTSPHRFLQSAFSPTSKNSHQDIDCAEVFYAVFLQRLTILQLPTRVQEALVLGVYIVPVFRLYHGFQFVHGVRRLHEQCECLASQVFNEYLHLRRKSKLQK